MAPNPVAPKNSQTRVAAERTIAEVQALLFAHGAAQVMVSAEAGVPCGVSFRLPGGAAYHLPVRAEQLARRLDDSGARNRLPTKDRDAYVRAVAWRTIKDWLAAQLDLIETGMVTLDEVMLPYRLLGASGTTVYGALAARDFRLPALSAPKGDADAS